jgi:hypothetical protein
MVHKRSREAQERRIQEQKERWAQKLKVKQIVLQNARIDPLKAETVNILSNDEVFAFLAGSFDGPWRAYAEKYSQGEVLVDSRGEGSLN